MTGVWVTNDTISAVRMNEKTIFQGSGSDINGLTTYAGMLVYCTSTGSGFVIDNYYRRNAANTSWSAITIGQTLDQVYPLSTTIADYSYPSTATASSGTTTNLLGVLDGTITETITKSSTGKIGANSWNFDGTAGNVAFTNAVLPTGTAARSISVWFKLDQLASTAGHDYVVVGIGNTGTTRTAWGLYIQFNGGNADKLQLVTVGDDHVISAALSAGVWYHVVITYAAAATEFKWSFNGSALATQALGGTVSANTQGYIGRASWTANLFLDGNVDQFLYYDDVITQGEIDAIYNSGTGTTTPHTGNLLIHYDFEDTTATVLSNTVPWTSNSENNPRVYFDLGSAKELHAIAIKLNRTDTTETEVQIRFSTDTTFTSGENVRTLTVSDFTDDTYRFITIPRSLADKQYFQIYGSTNSVVLSLHRIKYLSKSSADFERGHFHHYIPASVASSQLDSN